MAKSDITERPGRNKLWFKTNKTNFSIDFPNRTFFIIAINVQNSFFEGFNYYEYVKQTVRIIQCYYIVTDHLIPFVFLLKARPTILR